MDKNLNTKERTKENDIIVIGANSMVGSRVIELLSNSFSFFNTDVNAQNKIDITQKYEVEKLIANSSPKEPIIHFSAYTDVDQAEKERDDKLGLAWKINVDGTKNVAGACKKINKPIIFISTDFVFNRQAGPYTEDDIPAETSDEISWYGWTKLKGEEQVLEADIPYLILRISYPFRSNFPAKTDFVRNIITKLRDGNLYPMFDDQYLTPTYVDDLASAVEALIKNSKKGIYHVATPNVVTPYQVAIKVAEIFGFGQEQVKSASFRKYLQQNPQSAKRPQHGGLKTDKISKLIRLHTLEESLKLIKEEGNY